jgi:hypothetical protein
MPLPSRLFLVTVMLTLSAILLIRVDPARGQSSNGSAADAGLQILQGLSPEQRDAISRQLGGVGGAGGLGGSQGALGGRQQQPDDEQQNLFKQQQRDLLMDAQKQRAEMERLSPFLQSVVYGINAFDQWGVELGKKLCEQLAPAVQDPEGGHAAPAAVMKLLATVEKWRR